MVIYGWFRPTVVLAAKNDLCSNCGRAVRHLIIRRISWIHVFWLPVVPIWVHHRLVCGNCAFETKLSFGQVRTALKTGTLRLGPRPHFPAYVQARYDAGERRPTESEFDKVEKNPQRSRWELYFAVWTFAAAVVIGLIILALLN